MIVMQTCPGSLFQGSTPTAGSSVKKQSDSGSGYIISTKGRATSRGPWKKPTLFPRSDTMFLAARDVSPVPADETAAWVSAVDVGLKIDVFLLTLVAYDAGAYLCFQVSRACDADDGSSYHL